MKGELKTFFTNSYKVFKYAHIIIKASDEEVTNNHFVNNLMHLKSNCSETKSIEKCKIIIIAQVSKFLSFTHTKGCGLPERSVELMEKGKTAKHREI